MLKTIKNVGEVRSGLPKELACYLGSDAPPLHGKKAIDLGMALARMHYKVGIPRRCKRGAPLSICMKP